MVRPPRLSWSFLANPSPKVTLLQGELARLGQVKQAENALIYGGTAMQRGFWIGPGLGN
jgi:hypothetical protein